MSIKYPWIYLTTLLALGAAQALTLGGANVPKDHIIVYLLIGHSNMAGQVTVGTDAVTAPRIWNYQWFSNQQWVPAKETPGSFANGLSSKGEGGPGMSFLKDMATAYPDYNFGVVTNASFSATCRGLNTGNNSSGIPADSNRYYKGMHLYNEILAAAKAVQKDVTFGGIVCMLGTVEATRTSDTTCRFFGRDMAQVVKDLRTDLNEPNLPFLMGEYENGASGDFSLTLPWPKLVDSSTKAIPTMLSLSATINSVGIEMADDHHYSLTDKGRPEFSRRVVAMIKTKNWFPPPSISTSAIENGNIVFKNSTVTLSATKTSPHLLFDPQRGAETIEIPGMSLRIFDLNGKRPTLPPASIH